MFDDFLDEEGRFNNHINSNNGGSRCGCYLPCQSSLLLLAVNHSNSDSGDASVICSAGATCFDDAWIDATEGDVYCDGAYGFVRGVASCSKTTMNDCDDVIIHHMCYHYQIRKYSTFWFKRIFVSNYSNGNGGMNVYFTGFLKAVYSNETNDIHNVYCIANEVC